MADKKKFIDPHAKSYSVREVLTLERMSHAQHSLRAIQTHLRETMEDEAYSKIEQVFDTAIASLMAHEIGIEVKIDDENGADPEEGEPYGV